jgi:hypothetical protein
VFARFSMTVISDALLSPAVIDPSRMAALKTSPPWMLCRYPCLELAAIRSGSSSSASLFE